MLLKFWTKILFFSLGMAVILGLFSFKFNPMFEARLKKSRDFPSQLMERKIKYLVVGDSHAEKFRGYVSINRSFFNFSEGSDTYKNMLIKLKYAIKKNKPEVLLLEVDDHCFSQYREGSTNLLQATHFSDYSTVSELYDLNFLDYLKNKFSFWFPLTYQGNLQIFRRKFFHEITNISSSKKAFSKLKKKKNDSYWANISKAQRLDNAKKRNIMHYTVPFVRSVEVVFLSIIETCKKNNINIVFVKYPVTDEYLQFKSQYDLHKAESLINRFPEYKLLDYSNVYSGRPDLFKNCDHLNSVGAIEFSKRLIHDLGEK